MKLKNFNIPKELNTDLKYAAKISGKGEGVIIRELLQKNLRQFYPHTLASSIPCCKKIREHILKRHRHKCSMCGQKNKLVQTTRYNGFIKNPTKLLTDKYNSLVIHHKDGNPKNNVLSNLIPLCKRCHARTHLKSRKKK
jgi:5-methylcytosine-specific restriction endonuclease McrA